MNAHAHADTHASERPRLPGFAVVVWALLLQLPGCYLLATSWASARVGPVFWLTGVACTLVLLLGVRLGVSRWAAATLTTLLLVGIGYLATAGPGGSLVATLGDAVPRLLTAPRPIPLTGSLLAPGLLATGLVAILVTVRLTAVRRAGASPVIGGALLYVAGAALSSGAGDRYGLLAALLGATAVVGWAMLAGPHAPVAATRRVAPVFLAAVPVLAVGVVVASLLPRDDAFEPRTLVTPPLQRIEASSPLPQLAAWNEHPATELFRVSGDAYPLRMVTLTTYDGDDWRAATRYRPLGAFERSDLPAAQRRVAITEKVSITDLEGVWLPSPGAPTAVSRPDALVDPETGSVLLPSRPAGGVRYTVTGTVDAPLATELPDAGLAPEGQVRRYLALPKLPFPLATYAQAVVKDATTPYARAKAIERAVQGGRTFNAKAVGGSSYFRMQSFLLGRKGTPGAQTGSSEQFATAFALLARQNGLPTRLVVGFRPGTDLGDGVRSVRGSDAFAWPEVYFQDAGWVPFSPTPENGGFSQPDPPTNAPKTDQSEKSGRADGSGDSTVRPAGDVPATDEGGSLVPWVSAAAAGIIVLLVAGVLLARARRRRRHRDAGAVGAWQEVLDAARLSGISIDRRRTATDTAAAIAPSAVTIAERAERSSFGPDVVEGDGSMWELAVSTSRQLRGTLRWWRRLWWSFDPRTLLSRSSRTAGGRRPGARR